MGEESKELEKYLNADPSLTEKIMPEEFEESVKTGIDDSNIEPVYYTYKQVREKTLRYTS